MSRSPARVTRRGLPRAVKALLVAAFWIAVWGVLSLIVGSEILVPSPLAVARTWLKLVVTAKFWKACGATALRVVCGFCGAAAVGVLLGVACHCSAVARALISPVIKCLKAAPVVSFILLALVWVWTDYVPVLISFLTVVPVFYTATMAGLNSVDPALLEMTRLFRVSGDRVLLKIQLPAALPTLLSDGTVGLGFAWKSGIAAEVICLPLLSIGTELKFAKSTIDTPAVFAWTLTIIAFSVALEAVVRLVVGRVGRRWSRD